MGFALFDVNELAFMNLIKDFDTFFHIFLLFKTCLLNPFKEFKYIRVVHCERRVVFVPFSSWSIQLGVSSKIFFGSHVIQLADYICMFP